MIKRVLFSPDLFADPVFPGKNSHVQCGALQWQVQSGTGPWRYDDKIDDQASFLRIRYGRNNKLLKSVLELSQNI